MIDDRYILAPARQCLAPVYYRILLIYRNLVINNNQQIKVFPDYLYQFSHTPNRNLMSFLSRLY